MPTHSVEGIFGMSQKIALTGTTFLTYVLPPPLCLYFMGVLVQLKGTRFYRLALLPVVGWLAWRGSFVDMSGGDRKQAQMNSALIVSASGPLLHVIDVDYHRFICSPLPCGLLYGLLYESLFGVRVLRTNTNTTSQIPKASIQPSGTPET